MGVLWLCGRVVVVCCCVLCLVSVVVVCVWCVVLEKPPFCRFKRPRVYGHHAHMLKHMCACCQQTRERVECTHGRVLNLHTAA